MVRKDINVKTPVRNRKADRISYELLNQHNSETQKNRSLLFINNYKQKKMKLTKMITATVLAVATLASCKKEITQEKKFNDEASSLKSNESSANVDENENLSDRGKAGVVYTLSNQASGNMVLAYNRSADGTLTYSASYPTGGNGTGGGLGNQGAVVIGNDEEDDNVLLAVNAGSNTISSFKITGNGLSLKSTINSGGTRPVSIAQYDDLVYVLNAGGTGNISGFWLGEDGKLTAIPNSSRPLSSATAGAAEISFVRNGAVLAITEKATNKIITYTVDVSGLPGVMHSISSANPTPFGFAAAKNGNIYVSEAAGGAPGASSVSSYHISEDGSISLTQGPVATTQTAACWVVLTGNGKYFYTTNAGSNNISSYSAKANTGNISLLQSIAATSAMTPVDAALSNNSKFLYILNANGHSITAYSVAENGGLTALPVTVTGLPVGTNGLAAR